MAVDETLFRSALSGGPATLRLYRFQPPTVSYGYRQRLSEALDVDACHAEGVGFVRRPTGGRALLHQHELTYSLTAPTEGIFHGLAVRAVYHSVNQFLRRALDTLGVPLDPEPAWDAPDREPDKPNRPNGALPCLASARRHEITSGGRKLVASAQRRTRRAFLQHGVFLLRVDETLWARVAPKESPSRLEAVGMEELTPGITPLSLSESLFAAFASSFRIEGKPEELYPEERKLVQELLGKYRSEAWNLGPRAREGPSGRSSSPG